VLARLVVLHNIALALTLASEALHWMQVATGSAASLWAGTLGRVVIFLLTWQSRRRVGDERRPPDQRLFLARLWLALLCLMTSYVEWTTDIQLGGISRVCLVVCLAPVLIPDSLRRNMQYCADQSAPGLRVSLAERRARDHAGHRAHLLP